MWTLAQPGALTVNIDLSDGYLYFAKYFLLLVIYALMYGSLRSIVRSFPTREQLRRGLANQTNSLPKRESGITSSLSGSVVGVTEYSRSQVQPEEPRLEVGGASDKLRSRLAERPNLGIEDVPTSDPPLSVVPAYSGYIEVLAGLDTSTKRIPIEGVMIFGRSKDCTVRLPDMFVSSRHSRLSPTASGAVLEDLGSRNGTFCGENRITRPAVLHDGDCFAIGDCVFRYHKS